MIETTPSTRFRAAAGVVVLTASGLLAVATPALAWAAPATCDGRPATLVGESGATGVHGTDGDDVIVSNGARRVYAGEGDDVVCMTGGDTVVDTGDRLHDDLTTDHDVVIGTGGDDLVISGAVPDQEGAGDASLSSANDDEIRLGSGSSSIRLYGIPTGSLVGGPGRDTLDLRTRSAASWDVDLPAGTFTVGTTAAHVAGLDVLGFDETTYAALTVTGTDRGETVYPGDVTGAPVRLDLGGGDDTVGLAAGIAVEADGGAGRDRVSYSAVTDLGRPDRAEARFAAGDLTIVDHPEASFTSFADLTLSGARTLVVTGDAHANVIRLSDVCVGRVRGGGGADEVVQPDAFDSCGTAGARRGLTAWGGAGPDVLRGGPGGDHLYGGAGRDSAVGARGDDVCRAEVRRGC